MIDYNIILNNVKKIVCDFLKDQGGYSNGYGTYVKGSVRFNVRSQLQWMTPSAKDLTIKEHGKLGYELNDKIADYLAEVDFKDYIYINDYIGDFDCHYMTVSIKIEEPIRMDDF